MAHCVAHWRHFEYSVRGGRHARFGVFHRTVSFATIHPDYDPSKFENDLAILHLNEPFSFSNQLRPACLPSNTNGIITDFTGHVVTLAGWGCADRECVNPEDAFKRGILREAHMEVIGNDEATCWFMRNDGRDEYMPEELFITGGDEAGDVSTCKGDSGSPVILGETLIGLVSWS